MSAVFAPPRHFPEATIIAVGQSAEVTKRNKALVKEVASSTRFEFRQGDILQPDPFLTPGELVTGFRVVHEHATLICIPKTPLSSRK